MELTHEEVERYIDQISSGSKILDIGDEVVLFKFPSRYDLMRARRLYDKEYNDSIEEGLLSVDKMKELMKDRNLLTPEDRRKLLSAKSKLEAQKVLLAKTVKVKANQDRIKGIIHKLEDEIRIIEIKERSKFSMTAETKAEEYKILYLCWSSAYNFMTEELLWSEFDLFLNEYRLVFRQNVISEFILFYGGIPTSHIRSIARSNLWRIRYVTSLKTSEPLFGVPASQYTNNMLNLAYWSHYYQNIYEMLPDDQPSENIIEDDEALDAYLNDYYKERKKESVANKDKKKYGKLSAFDKDEVIVTKANELYEDIDYDKPREAQAVKDRNFIKKRTRRTKPSRR
ncbi:MAG TPA: hypothetical protein ENI23_03555 [bacterium]|nr:hypothetical protein [bacterium]